MHAQGKLLLSMSIFMTNDSQHRLDIVTRNFITGQPARAVIFQDRLALCCPEIESCHLTFFYMTEGRWQVAKLFTEELTVPF